MDSSGGLVVPLVKSCKAAAGSGESSLYGHRSSLVELHTLVGCPLFFSLHYWNPGDPFGCGVVLRLYCDTSVVTQAALWVFVFSSCRLLLFQHLDPLVGHFVVVCNLLFCVFIL